MNINTGLNDTTICFKCTQILMKSLSSSFPFLALGPVHPQSRICWSRRNTQWNSCGQLFAPSGHENEDGLCTHKGHSCSLVLNQMQNSWYWWKAECLWKRTILSPHYVDTVHILGILWFCCAASFFSASFCLHLPYYTMTQHITKQRNLKMMTCKLFIFLMQY